jgi:protein ImuB
MTVDPGRTIVLWCPDWPILAVCRELGLDPEAPLALTESGLVFACSAAARRDGVARGLKLREAQYRSPALAVLDYDIALDARVFEPVVRRVEATVPGVQLIRPGTLAMRARGPARYYGGEEAAAAALLETVGVPGARVGIADGPFAAEQAARAARTSSPTCPS